MPFRTFKKNLFWSGCNMIWSSVVSSSHTYIPHSGPNPIKAQRLISTSFIFFVTNQSGDCRVLSAKNFPIFSSLFSVGILFNWKSFRMKKKIAHYIYLILQVIFNSITYWTTLRVFLDPFIRLLLPFFFHTVVI